jgi:salicylate hydroxylase
VGYAKFESSRMHWKAMLEVITRLVPEGTVRFNRRVLGVRQRGGKGEMRFEDGECVVVDALVGCIGIRGVTRAVLQERWPEVAAKYTTTYVYRGIAPVEKARKIMGSYAEGARWWMMEEKRGRCILFCKEGSQVSLLPWWVGDIGLESKLQEKY